MKLKSITSLVGCAICVLGIEAPAHADWVSLANSGTPVTSCNPKDSSGNQSSTLTTCKVTGLPPAILSGYVLAASTDGSNITINSTVVGSRYDRVYCKPVSGSSTCDFTSPVVIATRAKMSTTVTNSAKNTHCPVWSSTTSDCFEINDFYRSILGSSSAEVSTDIAYFMGTVSGGTDPDTALALKYLEFAGKTNTGIWKAASASASAPGTYAPGTSSNRDATHIMFQADTNAYDPDGISSQWSPWLFVRQLCPNGYTTPTSGTYTTRLYEGGEEGQLAQSISSSGYSCTQPS